MNYCRRCGLELAKQNEHMYQCASQHHAFMNPTPAVTIFILDGDDLIVGRRVAEPGKGTLDSIGGFIDSDETIEEALEREVKEEANLEPGDYTKPVYFGSATNVYRYQDEDRLVISPLFWARLTPGAEFSGSDDIVELHRQSLDSINPDDFGMDDVKAGFKKLIELWKNDEL